jgi:hypothetical protein
MKYTQFDINKYHKNQSLFFRCFFILFFSIFTNGLIFSQQKIFQVGDNVLNHLNRNPPQFRVPGQKILKTPDGSVDLLKYQVEILDTDIIFLAQGSTVFGVVQRENNNTRNIYDINGDGILDVEHDDLFIPPWVLSKSQYTKISKNNKLPLLLDNIYEMFNNNISPYETTDFEEKYLTNFFSAIIDTSVDNRDLYYAMFQYYLLNDRPFLALLIISDLARRYHERFGTIHLLIKLFTAETLINLGDTKNAMMFINEILSTSPDYVPAKVYRWQLESNPTVRQRMYNELKKNFPNHWMVRQK